MGKKGKSTRVRPRDRRKGRDVAPILTSIRLWCLAFFLLSMPVFFLPGNTEYGYTKTVYTLVYVSVLVFLWGVEALVRKKWEIELTWLFPVIPAMLCVSLLSLTGGAAAGLVLQSTAVLLYFGVIYLLVVNTVRVDRDVVVLLGSLLAGGVITGLYGLLQYTGSMPGGPGTGLGAMISSMGNRQFLAGFLSYLVLPTAVLVLRLRRPWWQALALGAGGFVLAIMLLTRQVGVRLGMAVATAFVALSLGLWPARVGRWLWWLIAVVTALLALGLVGGWSWLVHGLVLLLGCGVVWGWATTLRRHRWVWIPTVCVVLVTLILMIPVTTPIAGVRDLWARQSGAVRAYDWWVGYEMWREQPAFGIGLGAYKVDFVPYKAVFLESPRGAGYDFPIPPAAQAHNEYVQVAAELGTVGFLVMLAGLGGIAWFGLRRIVGQEDPERRLELILLGGGVIVTLVHAVVTFPWRLPASSLAFVALLGLAFSPRYGPWGAWKVVLRGKALVAVVLAVALLGTSVSVIALRDLMADRYLFQGRNELNAGNVERAHELLGRAVELDFFPRVSLYWMGMAQLRAGELEQARDTFTRCFDRYVIEPLYVNLASVQAQLGEDAEARRLLEEVLATRPPRQAESHARYLLAVLELRAGNHDAAEEQLRELVAIEPHNERAWILLGDVARGKGDLFEARDRYEAALELVEDRIDALEARLGERVTRDQYTRMLDDYNYLREAREVLRGYMEQLP